MPKALKEDEFGEDYTLLPERAAWITVGKHSLRVSQDKVEFFTLEHEDGEPFQRVYLK